jgi:hypothetical protein
MSFLSRALGTESAAPSINYSPSGFTGGGLTGSYSGNNFSVTPDANRTGTVNSIADTYAKLGSETGDLRSTVAPGFNDMLKARLTDLDNQGTAAIGNLKQNLQSRRILGSSFGEDTISRANNTIQQQRDAVIADNFQKSLEANNQLLTQQYAAYAKQFQTGLDELNLEAGQASALNSTGSQILANNARTLSELNMKNDQFNAKMNFDTEAGIGKFLGGSGPSKIMSLLSGGL